MEEITEVEGYLVSERGKNLLLLYLPKSVELDTEFYQENEEGKNPYSLNVLESSRDEKGSFKLLDLGKFYFAENFISIVEKPEIWTNVYQSYLSMHQEFKDININLSSKNLVFNNETGEIKIIFVKLNKDKMLSDQEK